MKALFVAVLSLSLCGCAGMRIEASGNGVGLVRLATKIQEAHKRFCTQGVVSEKRDVQVEKRVDPQYYPSERTDARMSGEVVCK